MTKKKNGFAADVEVVDVRKIATDGNLKAFVDVKFSGAVIVKGFNVLMGKRGVFVTMPRKVSRDGRWFDILTPVSEEVKAEIETKILEAYEQS